MARLRRGERRRSGVELRERREGLSVRGNKPQENPDNAKRVGSRWGPILPAAARTGGGTGALSSTRGWERMPARPA